MTSKKRKSGGFNFGDPKKGTFGLAEPKTGQAKKARAEAERKAKADILKIPPARSPIAAPGQPFTPEAGAVVVSLLAAGHSLESAAASVGRDRTAVWRWRRRGETDAAQGIDSELARFAANYHHATGAALAQHEATMSEHARHDWRAGAFLMARQRPDLYGQKVTPRMVRLIVDRILDHVQEQATAAEFERFVELLSGDINVEGIEE